MAKRPRVERIKAGFIQSRGRPRKYPFNLLEPPQEENGETLYSSFFVPSKTPSQIYPSWRYWKLTYAKDEDIKLRFMKVYDDRGREGTRVIRVK